MGPYEAVALLGLQVLFILPEYVREKSESVKEDQNGGRIILIFRYKMMLGFPVFALSILNLLCGSVSSHFLARPTLETPLCVCAHTHHTPYLGPWSQ